MPALPIIPKRFMDLPKRLPDAIERALDSVAKDIKDDLEKPTRTWRHDARIFITAMRQVRYIGTNDDPYRYVTRGTRVRYATMTPDFIAKTTPRVLGAGPGRGGVMFISRRRPRPGIKAREFEEMAQENAQRTIVEKFNREIEKEL